MLFEALALMGWGRESWEEQSRGVQSRGAPVKSLRYSSSELFPPSYDDIL